MEKFLISGMLLIATIIMILFTKVQGNKMGWTKGKKFIAGGFPACYVVSMFKLWEIPILSEPALTICMYITAIWFLVSSIITILAYFQYR